MPRSAHPGAKKALAEIWNAEDRQHALDAVAAFEATYGAKFPKATGKITDDVEELLAVHDFPAEHWQHLRTTNPIETTSSRLPRTGGGQSTHLTSSPSSAPAPPSSAANSSNDPTTTTNLKLPKRSSSTGLDYCSSRRVSKC
jgi:hypothetical protein